MGGPKEVGAEEKCEQQIFVDQGKNARKRPILTENHHQANAEPFPHELIARPF